MNIYSRYNHPPGFYVYAYLRATDSNTSTSGTPYYIGKGSKGRAYNKNGHGCPLPISDNNIVIVESNLTEVGALALERRLIRWYGRIDQGNGILRNLSDGGDGTRQANPRRGKNHPNYGKRYTLSQEQKNRQKGKNKGFVWWNNGTKQTMAKNCPGHEYVRGRLSFNNNGAQLGADIAKLKKWFTNGIDSVFVIPGQQPKNYVLGRKIVGRTKSNPLKNAKWWTNEITSVLSFSSPGPEWKLGRQYSR